MSSEGELERSPTSGGKSAWSKTLLNSTQTAQTQEKLNVGEKTSRWYAYQGS